MKENKTIRQLLMDYQQGKYFYKDTDSIPEKLPDNHIFDEDKSYKWNRQQVAEYNAKIDLQIQEIKDKRAALSKKLHEDVAEAISREYGFTMEQSRIIECESYMDKHSCMSDYFYYCETLAEIINKVNSAK